MLGWSRRQYDCGTKWANCEIYLLVFHGPLMLRQAVSCKFFQVSSCNFNFVHSINGKTNEVPILIFVGPTHLQIKTIAAGDALVVVAAATQARYALVRRDFAA